MFLRSFVVAMLLIPCGAVAQVLQSFDDLPLRVNVDDQLEIEDSSGTKVTGRVIRLTRDELTIRTSSGEKLFARDAVLAAAIRGHALRRGALVGAAVFAVVGGVATCSHEGGHACGAVGPLRAAPIGAGLGLALGGFIPQMNPVYRRPENTVSVPRSPRAGGPEPGLLEELGAWVNLDDRLRIEEHSGATTTGLLTGLTDTEMTIQTGAGERRFTREAFREVAVRHHPLRMAALIGAGAVAAAGGLTACLTADKTECPDAALIGAGLGAGAGLLVGLLVSRTNVVYPATQRERQRTIRVAPFIPRGGGVALIGSWSAARD